MNKNLLLITILGLVLRLFYLFTNEIIPVDALQYIDVANFLKNEIDFYPNAREIGYPMLLATLYYFTNITFVKPQLLTIILGTLNILLIHKLSSVLIENWHIDNKRIPDISAFFLSTSFFAIKTDNSGVRETIIVTLIFSLFILIYNNNWNVKIRTVSIFILYFYISITRSEFQILALFIFVILIYEFYQDKLANNNLKIFSISILLSGILGLIFWMFFQHFILGDVSSTSNMFVQNIIQRNSPDVTPGNLGWYIFTYHGIIDFIKIEMIGFINLLIVLPRYLGIISYSLFVFGIVYLVNNSKFTILLLYVAACLINGFNAYEFNYIGSSRILFPFYSLFYIIIALPFAKIDDVELELSKDRRVLIKKNYISYLLLFGHLILNGIFRK